MLRYLFICCFKQLTIAYHFHGKSYYILTRTKTSIRYAKENDREKEREGEREEEKKVEGEI
jgi:hypothetical protein